MGIFDFLFGNKKTTSESKAIVKKLNNETIRIAVKEWLEDENRATKKYGFINDWDTSGVTDMNHMFKSAAKNTVISNIIGTTSFNQDISKWDVSSVTTMNRMFESATSFNQDVSKWGVPAVTGLRKSYYENGQLESEQNSDYVDKIWSI